MRHREWMRRSLRRTVSKNKALAAGLVLIIAATVAASLIPPLVLERAVNLLAGHRGISLGLALLYFLSVVLADILESAQNASITVFGQKVTHDIRSELCAKLDRLPADYFHTHESGKTASVFTNDGDAIDVLYSDGVVSMVADLFQVIGILAVIFSRSPGLGILVAAVTPFLFWFTRHCQKKARKAQLANRHAIARVNGHVPQTLGCIRMIHAMRAEKYMEDTYDGYIRESYEAVEKSYFIDSIYSPVVLLTQACVTAVMMILAAEGDSYRAFFGISVGTAVAMMAYINKIFSPLENIGMEIQNIQAASAAIGHMDEFFREPDAHPVPKKVPAEPLIRFDHVTFGYDPEHPVLEDFSFVVDRGEMVAFAGRTGAGKTTIFRLLTGLYDPQSGTISLAGQCPGGLKPQERRKRYGYVEQDFQSVPGTVRDQITLYDKKITEEQIHRAIVLAGLDQMLADLPAGLDTPMDTAQFSRGQLQLLSIARAVVSDPEILLLDEVTASLDAQTEAHVIRALRNSTRGRTVLAVSHRLSAALGNTRVIQVPDLSVVN